METVTSYEYASKMKELASYLLERPEFDTEQSQVFMFINVYTKEKATAVVRALGSGKKEFTDRSFSFLASSPEGTYVKMEVPRNKVCTLVRAAEYDCEPILTSEEAAAL
jgi:hypothetical protein